jgi:hypothetical protein
MKKVYYNIQDFINLVNKTFAILNAAENSPPNDQYEIEMESFYEHKIRITELLPKFTPMSCNNCTNKDKCNFIRPIGVCSDYKVQIDYEN